MTDEELHNQCAALVREHDSLLPAIRLVMENRKLGLKAAVAFVRDIDPTPTTKRERTIRAAPDLANLLRLYAYPGPYTHRPTDSELRAKSRDLLARIDGDKPW